MLIKSRRWVLFISLLLFFPTVNILFQNCGVNFRASSNSSFFSATSYRADLVWNSQDSSHISANGFNQVERWLDKTKQMMGLYPPLRANSSSIALEQAPLLEQNGSNKFFLNLHDRKELRSTTEDLRHLLSDKYTVGFFIDSIEIPTDQSQRVRVFDLMSPNGVSDGYVGIDISASQVSAFHWFSNTSYHFVNKIITSEELSKGLAIVVRYGPDYESLSLSINGELATEKTTSATVPPQLGLVTRFLRVNSNYAGNGGFYLYELALWNQSLSEGEVQSLSAAYYGSYVLGIGGGVTAPGNGSSNNSFASVAAVLGKARPSGSCTGCHGSITQRSWLMGQGSGPTQWVIPGDSAQSLLIKALRHASGATAMPPSGAAIPDSEIQVIEKWIDAGAK